MSKTKKPLILIVDDVQTNLKVLGNLLKKIDCQIAAAMNGQQALDTVAKIKPDLILLDVMMPVMNGHEVCKKLKSSANTKDIPVIFLTAKTETEDIVKGFELGAVDYVTKPFVGSELLARVRTHIALKKTREELCEENKTKNKFLSIISHDLRGSIGVVAGFANLLINDREIFTDEDVTDIVKDISKTSINTLELLDNLLNWARSQSGNIKINKELIQVDELIKNNYDSFLEASLLKNIKLRTSYNSDDKVCADKNMIQLVIRNLISNSLKFTPRGGEIHIQSEKNGIGQTFTVSDTGVGMNQDQLEKVFNIDEKVSTPGTEEEKGSGLGLVLCKEFIENNNGKISIESSPGKGTSISFSLPVGCNS